MWEDLGEYILNLKDKTPIKIAEIGIGKFEGTYDYLKNKSNINIIKTDILPSNESIIKDDITNPNLDLYKNIDIIYSIRPPSELHQSLMDLRDKTNSILIIKPLFNEDINIKNKKMILKNYKKSIFYIYGDTNDND
ncbi:UPF0146 family protein [Methanobrevibacter sp. DSM 116169]|uniref:UPF0146 family protein n=1 Tax=Methanobrevibacter sp. DSM 116169 TaxID=3242727 RepID=UPI0038FBE8C8